MTKPAVDFGTTKRPSKSKRASRAVIGGDQRTVIARRVKAIAATVREALREQGHTLTAALDLEVITLARVTCRLEIIAAEATKGFDTDDEVLTRLVNAQARGLNRLGLRAGLLAAPPPPRPIPSLAESVRRYGRGAAP